MKTKYNKFIYIGFILIGSVFLLKKEINQALIYFGISLVFDPFDLTQKFEERPNWQKLILIVNLSIVFGLIFIELYKTMK